jgi:carbamate kinase
MRFVVALGGNALVKRGEEGSFAQQSRNARESAKQIAALAKKHSVVLTHGNGPQVGELLLDEPRVPLHVLVAQSQGEIGYLLQDALSAEGVAAATILTRVEVDKRDPAFKRPTKPVGPFYTEPLRGVPCVEDAGRGYRRVVPSPNPLRIHESVAVNALIEKGVVPIACGGGGIPVSKGKGVDAVIDKDLAAELLARSARADCLLILTDVDFVYLGYQSKKPQPLTRLSVAEARRSLAAGVFAAGSMAPKVEAAARFAEHGGKAVICNLNKLSLALSGKSGTVVE